VLVISTADALTVDEMPETVALVTAAARAVALSAVVVELVTEIVLPFNAKVIRLESVVRTFSVKSCKDVCVRLPILSALGAGLSPKYLDAARYTVLVVLGKSTATLGRSLYERTRSAYAVW
jgi:hypothetical protein